MTQALKIISTNQDSVGSGPKLETQKDRQKKRKTLERMLLQNINLFIQIQTAVDFRTWCEVLNKPEEMLS